MRAPLAAAEYPNAAGIRLAWKIAEGHDSTAPIAELALALGEDPWHLHYADATRIVSAALRQSSAHGGRPSD